MENISLSIIIPHRNIPDLLQRCIVSIPQCEDIQVIVVDDNSDSSKVDFGRFPGNDRKNVETVFTKEGRGAGYARNVGLSRAKGEWLLFADSDDFFVEDFYPIVASYFNGDADEVVFKARSVDSVTLEPTSRNENINKRIDQVLAGEQTLKDALLHVQSPWCRLIKRDFVERHGIRFDEVMACNDAMFTTKVTCLANKIEVSPKELYVVTQREGSLWDSRKKDPSNILTRLEVQARRNKYVEKLGYSKMSLRRYLKQAWQINLKTFLKALLIIVRT